MAPEASEGDVAANGRCSKGNKSTTSPREMSEADGESFALGEVGIYGFLSSASVRTFRFMQNFDKRKRSQAMVPSVQDVVELQEEIFDAIVPPAKQGRYVRNSVLMSIQNKCKDVVNNNEVHVSPCVCIWPFYRFFHFGNRSVLNEDCSDRSEILY